MLSYIDAHLHQEIKLADLASLLGISEFYFSRQFKQTIGATPYHYVLQQRIELAKQLLKQSDRTIKILHWHVDLTVIVISVNSFVN